VVPKGREFQCTFKILSYHRCYTSHGAGDIAFGLDGTMFISHGDGAHWDRVDDGSIYSMYFSADNYSFPAMILNAKLYLETLL
jgi:hypothetical protein